MNKRYLHHIWTKIRPLSYLYFLILAVVSLGIGLNVLRQNNLRMIELRGVVTQADEQSGDVEAALRKLREHVYAHMNTNLASGDTAIRPPIQLKYRYERLVAAEKARAAGINEKVYTDAQAICEQLYPGSFSGGPRVPCIQDYVTQHGVQEQTVPEDLYKFDFVAPRWSPDLAGWSLLAAAVFLLLAVIRFGFERWIRVELQKHA